METLKADVIEEESRHYIRIDAGEEVLRIPLSEDNPNAVKSVFNKLITKLKDGSYEIRMAEAGEDLFSQVAKEYVGQLNKELQEVYKDLLYYGLVDGKEQGGARVEAST